MTIFFVQDKSGSGVGFTSEVDARYASTGEAEKMFVNELALNFRRISGAKKGQVFPIQVMVIQEDENTQNLNNKLS